MAKSGELWRIFADSDEVWRLLAMFSRFGNVATSGLICTGEPRGTDADVAWKRELMVELSSVNHRQEMVANGLFSDAVVRAVKQASDRELAPACDHLDNDSRSRPHHGQIAPSPWQWQYRLHLRRIAVPSSQ